MHNPSNKYRPFGTIALADRQWPSRVIEHAPQWCSVDLRDGNQALIEPMNPERKLRMFKTLVAIGFKEIEVGFPSASQPDFDFVRQIIEQDLIPEDVTIQVLTQARDHLIERTFEAVKGARRAIVHYYNATSPVFREVVFGVDRAGCVDLAVAAARKIKAMADARPETDWRFEYSPETFSATEVDFAVEVCDAVIEVFQPTPERRLIINLPTTVEVATPNVFADQVEWFCRHVQRRDSLTVSVHPHNDRGTGVATAELALMAGADRIEGTLFGNGERTGNVDVVTLALNMYTQGVDPQLDFSDINAAVRCAEHCNQLPVHPRHPYAGELVFTAFSGSHQDAIKKGFAARERNPDGVWQIPYLPVDPQDLGRSYEAVIRVNSQSGKGGVSFLLERDHGVVMPRRLQIEFSQVVQELSERTGTEVRSELVWESFDREYLNHADPFELIEYRAQADGGEADREQLSGLVRFQGVEHRISGRGNGPIDAFVDALNRQFGLGLQVVDYREYAGGRGADAAAFAYVEVGFGDSGGAMFGVGRHGNIVTASLQAVLSAANRAARRQPEWLQAVG